MGILALGSLASNGICAGSAPATPAPSAIVVTASAWSPRPFADVVLDTPELAACFSLSPGAWGAVEAPAPLTVAAVLSDTVRDRLAGLLPAGAPMKFTIVLAAAEHAAPAAVAFGATVLLIVPSDEPFDLEDAARAVIQAIDRAHAAPAAPDPRCSEPLLAVAEAIATAGATSLAVLPPALRPVADWLEAKDAAVPLAAFVDGALDRAAPWSQRRVRLRGTALTSGANTGLMHAAALLVETFGDPQLARRRPFELLLAWRQNRDKRFPAPPASLRRALADPLAAGMPSAEQAEERAEERPLIAADARERAVEAGTTIAPAAAEPAPLALRETAAALARATGAGTACQWLLAGDVPAGVRTGCRADEKLVGAVTARARPQGGCEIVAASASSEIVLLRWPRWLLFPAVIAGAGVVVFADEEGVWAVPLDSGAKPRLLASGSFRHLAVSPDGRTIAAATWPAGTIALIPLVGATRMLTVAGRGGVAWLDDELLLASDGKDAVIASTAGETRAFGAPLPCARSLARDGGNLFVASGVPCEPGIALLHVGEQEVRRIVARDDAPLGIVPLGEGVVMFGDADGILRWRPGEKAERVAGGLTPGPG